MLDWTNLYLFIIAASVLVFVPGPNTLYIIARSVQQGRMAGLLSAIGVEIGTLFHVAAAALGLTALLLSSALAFSIVKYVGAAYLIYLGIKTLLTKEKPAESEAVKEISLGRAFYQGVLVNILNPKTALFFTAFLPQFVDVNKGAVAQQIFVFGAILATLGIMSGMTYTLLAGSIGHLMRGNIKFLRGQRYFAGSVYLGLGAMTALTGSGKK